MSYQIKFSDESKLDLKEAITYYSSISVELAAKLKLEISEVIDRIVLNPEHFQKRFRHIKIVFTKIFPFGVHYIVEGNMVYVQGLMHKKQLYK